MNNIEIINTLKGGNKVGRDKRGLMSAAILIVSKKHPPIDLRIDLSKFPLKDLEVLYRKFCKKKYLTGL